MPDFDTKEYARGIGAMVRGIVEPLTKRLAELEARQPPKGDLGKSVTVSDVVRELLAAAEIRTLVNMEVADYLQKNPPAKGDPGKSLTVDDVSVFLDAAISKWALEFERRASDMLAKALDKIPEPKNGKDGIGFDDLIVSYDKVEQEVVMRYQRGDLHKEVRYPAPMQRHIGFWQAGMKARAMDTATHDGSLWIALRSTEQEPCYQSQDWQLAARKGADGASAPVKAKRDA